MSAYAEPHWFPHTKFSSPQLDTTVLERPELLEQIASSLLSKRLTVLSAPPGAGKTTALLSLVQQWPADSFAWLSLDPTDDEPLIFMAALVAALQARVPAFGRLQQLFTGVAGGELELKRLIGVLINEWLKLPVQSFVLVLDDLHVINNPIIYRGLDYLLDHLPQFAHLVVTTRQDPPLALTRLRTRGQLAEFTMQDLRFSAADLSNFLNGQLGLNLANADLLRLHGRTEGWIAAIRLTALALQNTESQNARSLQVNQFAQSQRFIFDYLISEVLQQQDAATQRFLLQSSILPELTPTLCAAVTGREDAAAVLEDLCRRNLFLMRLESTADGYETNAGLPEPVYRYHALFAQFLLRELKRTFPAEVANLHLRAARVATTGSRQIDHYIAAQAWHEAAAQIEILGRRALDSGHVRTQIIQWIEQVPTAIMAEHPWLLLIRAIWLTQQGKVQAADHELALALTAFGDHYDEHGETIALIYSYLPRAGELDPTEIAQLEARWQRLPAGISPLQQVTFHLSMAWGYQYRLQWAACEQQLNAALTKALQSNEAGPLHLLAWSIGIPFLFCEHGLSLVENYAQTVLTRYGQGDDLIHMGAYVHLACVASLQGNLQAAHTLAWRASQISQALGGFAWTDTNIDHVLVWGWLAADDYPAAAEYLHQRLSVIQQIEVLADQVDRYRYLLGRVYCLQGDMAAAQALFAQMKPDSDAFHLLGGLIALHEENYAQAEHYWQTVSAVQTRARTYHLADDAALNLALLYNLTGQSLVALELLRERLGFIAGRGMIGLFLYSGRAFLPLLDLATEAGLQPDLVAELTRHFHELRPEPVVQELSGAHSSPQSTPVAAISTATVRLSERELEVMRLLVDGLSTREIAERLIIAPSTAKRHVANLYNKLGVDNRARAIRRANELGLL